MEDIVIFLGLKVFNSDHSYMVSCSKNAKVTFVEKPQEKIIIFKKIKIEMQAMTIADKAVDGTILSREYLCMEDHLNSAYSLFNN